MADLDKFRRDAEKAFPTNKAFIKSLKRKKKGDLDKVFQQTHVEVFQQTDCLDCANCCKTTSPIFYLPDIERIARALKIKPATFIEEYLRVDEDQDYVLKGAPCPFLGVDNKCLVYENRPRACREYPHTDRKRVYQILNLTLKNTLVCPATLEIVKRIRSLSTA
ncbi:YkgJ family cysteine cluster protein [Fulvivirgaceae bacterium BMA12]|uniref:YkgJ family cysteine cluster protein n=1 Tax=Agaribacillus aureus TaxID=3051825 RepID=A0ABT8L089_9BACT|nr:YkgJ family cysteine cluster protein [Fulvivirgaceae bacterium BMA12]